MKNILRGLEILFKYYPSANFNTEHNQIWIHSWIEEDEVSEGDKKKLDKLGWFTDKDDGYSWTIYCKEV